jgi:hypothetical protein
MSPVDEVAPLVFSETGEGYCVNLACVAINNVEEKIKKKSLGGYFWLYQWMILLVAGQPTKGQGWHLALTSSLGCLLCHINGKSSST